MSNFPTKFDDDISLPFINDNITEAGGAAINALRDTAFSIEQEIGIGASGSTGSIANRLGVSFNPDGTMKNSVISSIVTSLGLITNAMIADNAGIPESKLHLDHRTSDLFNYITDLSTGVNTALGWISVSGVKLEAHLLGAIYNHTLNQINVNSPFLSSKFRSVRDNTTAYSLINDMNNELLAHQWADGTGTATNVTTNNGSTYPSTYAHTSSGIFLNTSRFATIPQTAQDLQQFAEFIDSSSLFLYGTRIQNLYSGGISRSSRSSYLALDGYGTPLVPPTQVTTYFLNTGASSTPIDDIVNGDDMIEFKPSSGDMSSNSFDEKFALVKVGDIVRVNYGTVETQFVIKEKKYTQSPQKYFVRIAGKNLLYTTTASARIDKPLFNNNKSGVLAIAAANNNFDLPSLIVGSPRGAMALGLGFNPDQLDSTHYMLYLALYPNGVPSDGYTVLPSIDVTGNRGATPGKYTLDSIVEATNTAFRTSGFNYRFIAFSYQGEFGVMLADSYNNAGFSIISAAVTSAGVYDQTTTEINFKNNVVGIFSSGTLMPQDALGFGSFGSGIASPPFMTSYGSTAAALIPTKLFLPLKRNNYYVNGIEKDRLSLEVGQVLDTYGDGYWAATIISATPNAGRVTTTYKVLLDLSSSNLKVGKTLVVQSDGYAGSGLVDYGRFIIQSINISCAPNAYTEITVYDSVHAKGASPATVLGVGGIVALYFCADSVSFNKENSSDTSPITAPFKRHFEAYTDQNGSTFTHERGRINTSGGVADSNGTYITVNDSMLHTYSELAKLNILKISPKLRGYQFGSVNKITLNMISLNSSTGTYDGYLSSCDGITASRRGPLTFGRIGQVTRFYDETNIDYVDIVFDVNTAISSFSNHYIDFQLFPTLSLDEEIMLIGTCQLNDKTVEYIRDERQFGNTSEKDFSSSALNFISLPERLLHSNGVIRGFDFENIDGYSNPNNGQIYLTGGTALVNGKFIQKNSESITIPLVKELAGILYNINWALCVNDRGEYQPIPLLDFDAVLGTPLSSSRLFTAFNMLNGSSYLLDSTTFSDLINNRKDLTILYIVAATVLPGSGITPPSITLSLTDARKYVNDADSNLPLKLTAANAQGNFKNMESIFSWIKYNNAFNGTAIVKSASGTSGTVNSAITLNFNDAVTIDGQNDATLTMNGAVIIGSNVTLKNLTINFYGGISAASNISNTKFENCIIHIINPVSSPPVNNIIFDLVNGSNISFIDCTISIQYSSAINSGAVFRLTNTQKFKFEGNTLSVLFDSSPGTVVPGDVFIIKNSSNLSIVDSSFTGNFNEFLRSTTSNSWKLDNLHITSTYNPGTGPDTYNVTTDPIGIADGLSTVTYSTSNFVNNGRGYIYSKINTTLDDVEINNVTFNYTPAAASTDRFSFINLELSQPTSVLSNLKITNCKFNSNTLTGTTEDFRPAIAIINTSRGSFQPLIQNIDISNNFCNRNQSIIITSHLVTGRMTSPGLWAVNCSVNNNVCGTIGYWISSGSKTISISPNVNALSDKNSGLTIANNTCHLITNVDETGKYFLVSKLIWNGTQYVSTNQCTYPSGFVNIKNNNCNWIHVGISYEESSSIKIIDNNLCAYDVNYLYVHNDWLPNDVWNISAPSIGISTGYAIFVGSNQHVSTSSLTPGEGADTSCIVSGNTVQAGYWLQTTGTSVTYKYPLGYIFTQGSGTITNNSSLKGVDETAGFGSLILLSGTNNIVTNNRIYRDGKNIFGYVTFASFDVTTNVPSTWDGTGSSGIITDNFFDSPYISDISFNETVINLGLMANATRWITTRNKNQTGHISIPMTNSKFITYRGGGPTYEYFGTPGADFYVGQAPSYGALGYKSQVIHVHDSSAPALRELDWQENLDKYLPNGVRLLQVIMGVKNYSGVIIAGANAVSLFLNKYAPAINYVDLDYMPTTSSLDLGVVNDGVNAPVAVITGGQLNSTSNTLYLNIDTRTAGLPGNTDISDQFITGAGYSFGVSVDLRFTRSTNCDFYLSPLHVKYRW